MSEHQHTEQDPETSQINHMASPSTSVRLPPDVYRELKELQRNINEQGYANLPSELLQHIAAPKRCWITMADVISMLMRHMREFIRESLRIKTRKEGGA